MGTCLSACGKDTASGDTTSAIVDPEVYDVCGNEHNGRRVWLLMPMTYEGKAVVMFSAHELASENLPRSAWRPVAEGVMFWTTLEDLRNHVNVSGLDPRQRDVLVISTALQSKRVLSGSALTSTTNLFGAALLACDLLPPHQGSRCRPAQPPQNFNFTCRNLERLRDFANLIR